MKTRTLLATLSALALCSATALAYPSDPSDPADPSGSEGDHRPFYPVIGGRAADGTAGRGCITPGQTCGQSYKSSAGPSDLIEINPKNPLVYNLYLDCGFKPEDLKLEFRVGLAKLDQFNPYGTKLTLRRREFANDAIVGNDRDGEWPPVIDQSVIGGRSLVSLINPYYGRTVYVFQVDDTPKGWKFPASELSISKPEDFGLDMYSLELLYKGQAVSTQYIANTSGDGARSTGSTYIVSIIRPLDCSNPVSGK